MGTVSFLIHLSVAYISNFYPLRLFPFHGSTKDSLLNLTEKLGTLRRLSSAERLRSDQLWSLQKRS
jgi:hypothetical protein